LICMLARCRIWTDYAFSCRISSLQSQKGRCIDKLECYALVSVNRSPSNFRKVKVDWDCELFFLQFKSSSWVERQRRHERTQNKDSQRSRRRLCSIVVSGKSYDRTECSSRSLRCLNSQLCAADDDEIWKWLWNTCYIRAAFWMHSSLAPNYSQAWAGNPHS